MMWKEFKRRVEEELAKKELDDVEIGLIEIRGYTADGSAEDLYVYISEHTCVLEVC